MTIILSVCFSDTFCYRILSLQVYSILSDRTLDRKLSLKLTIIL